MRGGGGSGSVSVASRFVGSGDPRTRLSVPLDRDDLGTVAQFVQVVRPRLQHLAALLEELGPVVGPAQRVLHRRARAAPRSRLRPHSVARRTASAPSPGIRGRHLVAREAHASQGREHTVVAHRPFTGARAREQKRPWPVSGCSSRRIAMACRDSGTTCAAPSAFPAWYASSAQQECATPRFEIELGPLGLAQLTRADEHQRRELKRRASDRHALVAFDGPQQLTDSLGSVIAAMCCTSTGFKRATQVGRWVRSARPVAIA